MKKRLLLVRNPDSPLLKYFKGKREDQQMVLMHNAVFSQDLRDSGAFLLKNDAVSVKPDDSDPLIDYDEMLRQILEADQTIVI